MGAMTESAFLGLDRAGDRCARCGEALAPGEPAFAVLEHEEDRYRRRDFCQGCFALLSPRPECFFKRTPGGEKARANPAEKRAAQRRELDALLDLFERLSRSAEAATAARPAGTERPGPTPLDAVERDKLRYLLALALVRKRRLELVELARSEGSDMLVVRATAEADLFAIPAPPLSEEEAARLARALEAEVGLA